MDLFLLVANTGKEARGRNHRRQISIQYFYSFKSKNKIDLKGTPKQLGAGWKEQAFFLLYEVG